MAVSNFYFKNQIIDMYSLTKILSAHLPSDDLIAVQPNWTRTEFNQSVFRLSARLCAQEIKKVALWFEDSAWFSCALLATWHAGAEAWLIPNLAEENQLWAEQADCILTDSHAFSGSLKAKSLPNWLETLPQSISTHTTISPTASLLLKTSGSSGTAQLVRKTAQQLQIEAQILSQTLPFNTQHLHAIGSVNPQHMYGLTFRFALSLTMGWSIVRQQAVYPEDLLATTQQPCVWIASPAVLNRMGTNHQFPQNLVRGIISAGSALPEKTSENLATVLVRPFEIYGSTETGVIAHRQHEQTWQPFASVEIQQQADDTFITRSAWAEDWFHSADVIAMQTQGFSLLGRQDRIIKLEDKRISLTQIEHQLCQHHWIADAYCAVHPNHNRLAMWVALNTIGIEALRENGRIAVINTLKKYLAHTQDKIALPRYWRFTTKLPRNTQDKIIAQDFQAAFTQPITSPQWQTLPSTTPNTWLFKGIVPLDLCYFHGHFANFPLVPGVIELQWIQDLCTPFTWSTQAIEQVENLKFQQFIRPNDEITITLTYDEIKNKLSFKITNPAQQNCASGRLVYTAATKQK